MVKHSKQVWKAGDRARYGDLIGTLRRVGKHVARFEFPLASYNEFKTATASVKISELRPVSSPITATNK